ncbi:MAG: Gfo/Idh/MocA family protein [Halanaerobiaceae bacterium]
MLKIGMISGWHVHARGYAKEINARNDAQVEVIWDEDEDRGQSWAQDIEAKFESDLDKLLNDYDLDGVVINAPTNRHKEILVKAAEAGIHIFTEKVMTLKVAAAREAINAIQEAGVEFCISFPHRTKPEILFAHKLIEKGKLGDISMFRVRNAHNGASGDWLPDHFYDQEQCGGGAMIDLGAHGMYLARFFLGQPKRITSIFNNLFDKPVEDNAISTIEFTNNAVAVNETGFVTPESPFSLEVYGTEGSIFIGGTEGGVRFKTKDTEGWETPDKLPEPLPDPIDQWLDSIQGRGKIHFGLEEGLQLTELMEKAYLSHKKGEIVTF